MRTALLYLLTPAANDGAGSTVHFTPQLGVPDPTRHVVRVELPPGHLSMEAAPVGETVLVWRLGDLWCAYTAAEVLALARRNSAGFRLADA